jgi:protein-L-isoaspartate(D-aspartate) O-methyltransferase
VTIKASESAFDAQRAALVERLRDQGHVRSAKVEAAMRAVPRERFVPPSLVGRSYVDEPLPIGHRQTISAPHMVAIMTEALEPFAGAHILEVGTGSGYQAAILSHLVGPSGAVVSIERLDDLAQNARRTLRDVGADNVTVVAGDGSQGFAASAPYDRILVTAAAPEIPEPLLAQLGATGVIVIPVGGRHCELFRVRKAGKTTTQESLGLCAFVPLLGAHGQRGLRLLP